ncbi:hypothetical protein HWV62_5247 [Athelia sp. TMB]|nr:hypothetical protein HWV62_5247 [Athelia sp. TMB]
MLTMSTSYLATVSSKATHTKPVRAHPPDPRASLKPPTVIPFTHIFHSEQNIFPAERRVPRAEQHIQLHARVTALSSHSVTLSRAFPEHGLSDVVYFDYAIYALGSHLPAPINLWGPPPSVKSESEVTAPFEGGKAESVAWLQQHQKAVAAADSVLIVGGGALGIQKPEFATDIASVHPGKKVTLLHSRQRLLPRFDPSMHTEIIEALDELNVEVILGERLELESTQEEPPKRNAAGQRVVQTVTGREIAADLLLLCTGQKPNTELLDSMDSRTVINGSGLARVLRTLQLTVESTSSAETPLHPASDETTEPTPYPHIFAIGDAADAFGAINAGHVAFRQGALAARNIVRLAHRAEGTPSEDDELELYDPGLPAIRVSLGLRKSVWQSQGAVGTRSDGAEDLNARFMWGSHGFPNLPKTPFDEILQTNSSVPAAYNDQIESILSGIHTLEQEIDPEVRHIQVVLAELLAKQTALRDQARKLAALRHPIRKLPAEILAEILVLSVDTLWLRDIGSDGYSVSYPGDGFDDFAWASGRFVKLNKMPLVLSSVCVLWRSVALTTPALWSSISLVIEPKHKTSDVLLIGLWLERAREMPLSICLSSRKDWEGHGIDTSPVLNLFASRSEQWREVDLLLPSSMMDHFSSIHNRLPKLQWLSVGSLDEEPQDVDMFEVAPQLASFQFAENLSPHHVVIPWTQLRHCDLGCTGSPQEYLDTLRLMSSVETCRLYIMNGHDFMLECIPFKLQRLRSLVISDNSGNSTLLLYMDAPELREFSMKALAFIPQAMSQDLVPWIRSHKKLQRLTLGSRSTMRPDEDRGPMLALLRGTPDLRELHLLGEVFPGILIAFVDAFSALLPRLQAIVVEYDPNPYAGAAPPQDVLRFLDVVSSRSGTGLRRVEIICTINEGQSRSELASIVPAELSTRIAELRRAGLDITMTCDDVDFFDEVRMARG